MTSTTIGLPDRYRPLDEVGPEEQTPTGVIRTWRAKDRVLNRDVAVRVHTPSGPAARDWITRALTAGGLANPALAMVYDAAEGSGDSPAPGAAAYVVNEWIEGETLAARLARGPLSDRDVRPLLRRLADGVAEAHRVGLAVGGLTPEHVVLRPNGLVGLRGVPAASGTIEGDIRALGDLIDACLTGLPGSGRTPGAGAPDLVALARRARSTEPGHALSSVAAMAALLAERPRQSTTGHGDADPGRRRRGRDRRVDPPAAPPAAEAGRPEPRPPVPLDPTTRPPVPPTRPVPPAGTSGRQGDTVSVDHSAVVARGAHREADEGDVPFAVLTGNTVAEDGYGYGYSYDDGDDVPGRHHPSPEQAYADDDDADYEDGDEDGHRSSAAARRGVLVFGLPVLALAVVIALAWWLGSGVLSVTRSVDGVDGSLPSIGPTTGESPAEDTSAGEDGTPTPGEPVPVESGSVFDPGGDGAPENDDRVPQSFDGDAGTAWSTLTYRGSPAFGNLKDGVGVVYDLGADRELAGAVLRTTTPGAAVEVRAASGPDGDLADWPVLASGTLEETTEFTFDEVAGTRYVLVWITDLVPSGDGFAAEVAEVELLSAG